VVEKQNKGTHFVDALTPNAWLLTSSASFTVLLFYTTAREMQHKKKKIFWIYDKALLTN